MSNSARALDVAALLESRGDFALAQSIRSLVVQHRAALDAVPEPEPGPTAGDAMARALDMGQMPAALIGAYQRMADRAFARGDTEAGFEAFGWAVAMLDASEPKGTA